MLMVNFIYANEALNKKIIYTGQNGNLKFGEKVSIADIVRNPKNFYKRFIVVSGYNRGWGTPKKAKKVWGTLLTRSDWVLEDNSGAVYITGLRVPKKILRPNILAEVVRLSGDKWAIRGERILKKESYSISLHVGEEKRIPIPIDRSHIYTYTIEGKSVKVKKDSFLGSLIVKGISKGKSTLKIFIYHFSRMVIDEKTGKARKMSLKEIKKGKPAKVYEIYVK